MNVYMRIYNIMYQHCTDTYVLYCTNSTIQNYKLGKKLLRFKDSGKLRIPVQDNVSTKLHMYVYITDNYVPN